jgi:hypothetical protein
MNRLRIIWLALVVLLWARVSGAAVIQHDWKTPGDGLLTYDDVNQREWLDLSQTLQSSQFPVANQEAKYQYVFQCVARWQAITEGVAR